MCIVRTVFQTEELRIICYELKVVLFEKDGSVLCIFAGYFVNLI